MLAMVWIGITVLTIVWIGILYNECIHHRGILLFIDCVDWLFFSGIECAMFKEVFCNKVFVFVFLCNGKIPWCLCLCEFFRGIRKIVFLDRLLIM